MQDDGPDEAQGELGVAVHDLIAADVHQFDLHIQCTRSQSSCMYWYVYVVRHNPVHVHLVTDLKQQCVRTRVKH